MKVREKYQLSERMRDRRVGTELKVDDHVSSVRSKEDFLVFGSPLIEDAEIKEVLSCLHSGWLGTGPKVHHFEKMFREYKGGRYAAALNSCTAALHLSLLTAGIGRGDEVISTAMTFCATINAIIHSGAAPVLVDCQRGTMNIDPARIEQAITPRTKAIIVVHFAGRPCDMDAIMDIAHRHNLIVIEDCAHAIESEYKGKKAGTIGDMGCFSFYVTKNIVTGEGGMVLISKKAHDRKIRMLALHGLSSGAWRRFSDKGYKHYKVMRCGYKYNMMDLQAAIGIRQLEKIESYWKKRQKIWEMYNNAFSDLPVELPRNPELRTRHAYHLYTLLIDKKQAGIDRNDFLNAMTRENIGVGVHYLSIAKHPFYQKAFGWKTKDYTNARYIGKRTVSLPISPKLSKDDVLDVIMAVKKVLKNL